MAYELVYTSVPQGIRTGSSGFCTVAYTNGLSASMVLKLESMSAYKNYFQPNDPQSGANPVAYSHYTFMESGQQLHILSRISYYGLDYTMRSNKLAHHVAALASECSRAVAGPAAVAARENFFRTAWQEEPQLFPKRKELPQLGEIGGVAVMWQRCTGDAGWAGVLAQSFLDSPRKPVFIIFDPLKHVNNLQLVDEALRLLPAEKRWQVNFNTYFTMLPAGMNCHWRFCVPGADVLRVARSTPGTLVIDLTAPLPGAGEGPLQQQAREGVKRQAVMPAPTLNAGTVPPPPPPGGVKKQPQVPLQVQVLPPPQPGKIQPQIVCGVAGRSGAGVQRRLLIGGAILLLLLAAAGSALYFFMPEKSRYYDAGVSVASAGDGGVDTKGPAENSVNRTQVAATRKTKPPVPPAAKTPSEVKKPPVATRETKSPAPVKKTQEERDLIARNRRELWWRSRVKISDIRNTQILRAGETLFAVVIADGEDEETVKLEKGRIAYSNGITASFECSVAVSGGKVEISDFKSKWKIKFLLIRDAKGKEMRLPLFFEYGSCDIPKNGTLGVLQMKLAKENVRFSCKSESYERVILENNPGAEIILKIGPETHSMTYDVKNSEFTALWKNNVFTRFEQAEKKLKKIKTAIDKVKADEKKSDKKKNKKREQTKTEPDLDKIVKKLPAADKKLRAELQKHHSGESKDDILKHYKDICAMLKKEKEALESLGEKRGELWIKTDGKKLFLRRFSRIFVDKKGLKIK